MNRTSPKKCSGLLHGIYRLQVPTSLSQIRDGIGETDNTKVRGTSPSGAGTDGYMGLPCCSRGGVCIVSNLFFTKTTVLSVWLVAS